MRLLQAIKEIVLSHQPSRIVAKSVRNLFFPAILKSDLRRTISIEVSSVCDAKCIFCNYRFDYREKKIASLEWFTSVARSSIALGYRHLDLTSMGGELFTHKNAVEIIRAAKDAGFETISTFTNAIQLHRFNIDKFLTSGISYLFISTPGFSDDVYRQLFGVHKYSDFKKSVEMLLATHQRLNSTVEIFFEPRTYLTMKELQQSEFYSTCIARYLGERIHFNRPLRVFDTWGGDITGRDMINDMKIDLNPLKSLAPFKKVHPCERLFMVGIHANGDVRLCNCRYDSSIETKYDTLRIDSLASGEDLEALMQRNDAKIKKVRRDFVNGRLPTLCEKCPFYIPVRYTKE